jgi:hypothetical protein
MQITFVQRTLQVWNYKVRHIFHIKSLPLRKKIFEYIIPKTLFYYFNRWKIKKDTKISNTYQTYKLYNIKHSYIINK